MQMRPGHTPSVNGAQPTTRRKVDVQSLTHLVETKSDPAPRKPKSCDFGMFFAWPCPFVAQKIKERLISLPLILLIPFCGSCPKICLGTQEVSIFGTGTSHFFDPVIGVSDSLVVVE